jgi:DNA-directed RNA polymerase sigma subunit (sigma70/sigma32)
MAARAQGLDGAIALTPALARAVERIMRDMPMDELQVLRLRFGIGARRCSRRVIARRLGIGAARVRRLELRALRDLRALALPRNLPRRRNASRDAAHARRLGCQW